MLSINNSSLRALLLRLKRIAITCRTKETSKEAHRDAKDVVKLDHRKSQDLIRSEGSVILKRKPRSHGAKVAAPPNMLRKLLD